MITLKDVKEMAGKFSLQAKMIKGFEDYIIVATDLDHGPCLSVHVGDEDTGNWIMLCSPKELKAFRQGSDCAPGIEAPSRSFEIENGGLDKEFLYGVIQEFKENTSLVYFGNPGSDLVGVSRKVVNTKPYFINKADVPAGSIIHDIKVGWGGLTIHQCSDLM